MNCLFGDPTTDKLLPLISAASKAGCDYFVIDAGWYAELNERWWGAVGMWKPGLTRFPNGIEEVLDSIKNKGMIPGLWLEIERAGINSPLNDKPDEWFFMRHGERVIVNSNYFLDFRNPDVRKYADEVIDRLVEQYGVGYIKMDYNVNALMGTETDASSPGQGLIEHQRAYLQWMDNVYKRYPELVIENCGSGGCRMDYAMLKKHQIQSSSDQTDYARYPAILVGALATVLPEQLAVWTYPLQTGDKYEASFNMVSSMLCRVHQSGHLAELPNESFQMVQLGIEIYKNELAPLIPKSIPFFPLGMPSILDHYSPIALGLKTDDADYYAIWRLQGKSSISIPLKTNGEIELIYPNNLGIELENGINSITVRFPKTNMAVIVKVEKG
jgi:alpha-galactosidase